MVQIVGLSGGIACGKSTCVIFLKSKGYKIIDADALAKEALEPGTFLFLVVSKVFEDCLDPSGKTIDRLKLGNLIFVDPRKRHLLQWIIHPYIYFWMIFYIICYWFFGQMTIVVDVPLLFETGLHRFVSFSLLISWYHVFCYTIFDTLAMSKLRWLD